MQSAATSKAPILLALLLCGLAFLTAYRTTADLTWPGEEDFFRDMGSVETLQNGDWLQDPVYRGEYRWYNPLTPAIVAFIQYVTQIPLPMLYAKVGTYLNLLAPFCLFWLVAMLFDRWAAVAAVACYLFLGIHAKPSWFGATYSPWLWPCNFTQVLFLLTAGVYFLALRRRSLFWEVASGVLLGLTFLSHTAPALLLATFVAVMSVGHAARHRHQFLWHLRPLFIIGGVSFLVSLPFLGPLLFVYRMQTVNAVPASFDPFPGNMILGSYVSVRSLIAACGLAALVLNVYATRKNRGVSYVLSLTIVVIAFLLHGLVVQAFDSYKIEHLVVQVFKRGRIVPLFHFQIYTKLIETILFGVGMVWLCNMGAARLDRGDTIRRRFPLFLEEERPRRALLFVCVILGSVMVSWTWGFVQDLNYNNPWALGYLHRRDFTHYRNLSLSYVKENERNRLYDWVRRHTAPDAVFLCDEELALYAVGAAGRKVVCIEEIFSNPFVSYQQRAKDRDAMFVALRNGDMTAFEGLAASYAVTYVIARNIKHDSRHTTCRMTDTDRAQMEGHSRRFHHAFRAGDIWVYKIMK